MVLWNHIVQIPSQVKQPSRPLDQPRRTPLWKSLMTLDGRGRGEWAYGSLEWAVRRAKMGPALEMTAFSITTHMTDAHQRTKLSVSGLN